MYLFNSFNISQTYDYFRERRLMHGKLLEQVHTRLGQQREELSSGLIDVSLISLSLQLLSHTQ
jgi:hypothetical protein